MQSITVCRPCSRMLRVVSISLKCCPTCLPTPKNAFRIRAENIANKEHGWVINEAVGEFACLLTELQRDTFSSDSPNYQKLDTDFIVGTAIRYFEKKGFNVFWEHLSNDPTQEKKFAQRLNPVIQNSVPHIHKELQIQSPEKLYWKWPNGNREKCLLKLQEAEDRIFKVLDEMQLDISVK